MRRHAAARGTFADPSLDSVERARRYFVATCQSFAGLVGDGFSRSTAKPVAKTFANHVDGMHAVAERLRHVIVERLSAEDLIAKNDGPDTLFYVDPPYDPTVRTANTRKGGKYRHEMSLDDHAGPSDRPERGAREGAAERLRLAALPADARRLARLLAQSPCSRVSATALDDRGASWRTEVLWANFNRPLSPPIIHPLTLQTRKIK